MPELTVEAATAPRWCRQVWRVYSHELTPSDVHELNSRRPTSLLTGGTDGGNKVEYLVERQDIKSL